MLNLVHGAPDREKWGGFVSARARGSAAASLTVPAGEKASGKHDKHIICTGFCAHVSSQEGKREARAQAFRSAGNSSQSHGDVALPQAHGKEEVVVDGRDVTRPFGRREVLIGAGAAAAAGSAVLAGGGLSLALEDKAPNGSPQFDIELRKVIGQATPLEEGVGIDLPEVAENGNIVPYTLSVESPMTADDYVAHLHLLSTANPNAAVATFHFTPQSGKATVTGRMRLAKTQDVVAVAVTSTGKLMISKRNIEVLIGGCGSG
jgi:sulfur-oxidizing protein SoxY